MSFVDPVREAKAVASLRESLAAVDASDEALLLDTIEGETGLYEALDALVERIREGDVMISGIKSVEADLSARRFRYEEGQKRDRALIAQALMIAELDKVVRPTATLSIGKRAPTLQVTEEADVPARFWKAGAPCLDKRALLEAVKARAEALAALPEDPADRAAAIAALPEDIPGAALSNAAPALTIRTK